jgi:stalled ribosome rescue protein Dom34
VALADTNSLRLFVSQPERLEELPSIDDDPDDYSRVRVGGSSQAEHHVDEHRRDFARRAADLVAATMTREETRRLILAGVDAAVAGIREHLPKAVSERVRETLHVGPNSHGEIEAGVLPAIEKLEAADATDAADRLVGSVASDGAGVAGIEPTARALEAGQGLELLIDEGGPASESQVETLVHLAARAGTPITFVRDHAGLRAAGGVGALLRYRP